MALLSGPAGAAFANVLHTGGAIAFLAGIVIFAVWARGARLGDPAPRLLRAGMALTYLAILVNLFGGFVRTYAPGHPSLSAWLDEPWVLMMLIKHGFLFAGMFAAAYLYEVVAPRIRRGASPQPGRKESAAVAFIAVSILIATVLGAVAGVTHIGAPEAEPPTVIQEPTDPDGVLLEDDSYRFQGQLTSVPPVQPGQSEGTFRLPENVGVMVATLSWDDDVAELDVAIDGLSGTSDGDSMRYDLPPAGTYTYTITGENAVNVAWTLQLQLTPARGLMLLTDTVRILPGEPAFFEINLDASRDATISWDWEVGGGQEVPFNLHTHFDGQVQYVVDETAAAGRGAYSVQRTGGHSLMWENPGTTPIEVQYRVWGDFTVDSYYPSASTKAIKLLG